MGYIVQRNGPSSPKQEKKDVGLPLTKESDMFTRTCSVCSRTFETKKSEATTCYDCCLERLTGDRAPEEGDFNTARISSGQMTEQQERWLREDLESVDHSGEQEMYDEEPDRWAYLEDDRDE